MSFEARLNTDKVPLLKYQLALARGYAAHMPGLGWANLLVSDLVQSPFEGYLGSTME